VRLFGEAMRSGQANCMDGSAILASIFRRIGIEPFLVVIPGHSFMGYYSSTNKDRIYCLETTMIGNRKVKEADVDTANLHNITRLFPDSIVRKNKNAILDYAYALQLGMQTYQQVKPDIEKRKLQYLFIDIDKSRKDFGVIPIANN
jgi:hypothetical protein